MGFDLTNSFEYLKIKVKMHAKLRKKVKLQIKVIGLSHLDKDRVKYVEMKFPFIIKMQILSFR